MLRGDVTSQYTRREMLMHSGRVGLAATAGLAGLHSASRPARAEATTVADVAMPRGTAESCIFIWLGGGACHIDTWDPKQRGDGKKRPGSYYDSIPTAIPHASVCEHLRHTAPLLDRAILVRSVHHELQDHQAATNRLHTGRPTSGTILYPSLGPVVSHQRGPRNDRTPAYIVIGYPNATRNPGFLGAQFGYLCLTETAAGPTGLKRPPEVTPDRQMRREALLARVRKDYVAQHAGDEKLANYAAVSRQGFQLAGPDFMNVFQLERESAKLRESYGGEFGQRCLLARRLVQNGARFVEVAFNLNFINGT